MSRITDTIARASVYQQYLTSAMIDKYQSGDTTKGDRYGIDAITVAGLKEVLSFYLTNGDDLGMTATDVEDVISKIAEYQYSESLSIIDFTAQAGSDADALGSGKPIVFSSAVATTDFVSFVLTATIEGQTGFTMPYNTSQIADSDYTTVTRNDLFLLGATDYTMSGTSFTYTGEVPLGIGWKLEIRMLINK